MVAQVDAAVVERVAAATAGPFNRDELPVGHGGHQRHPLCGEPTATVDQQQRPTRSGHQGTRSKPRISKLERAVLGLQPVTLAEATLGVVEGGRHQGPTMLDER